MSKSYEGDINGNLFTFQSSDDADFFGSKGDIPQVLEYVYLEHEKKDVVAGIEKCVEAIGKKNIKIMKDFFDKDLAKGHAGLTVSFSEGLKWYARYYLGNEILRSLQEKGRCKFQVELQPSLDAEMLMNFQKYKEVGS